MGFNIQDVINTLNMIDVRGKDNLDRMLGAILALEAILADQNKPKEDEVE